MTECYFVTGTDTGIGKTVASVSILQAACRLGWMTAGYKPVATGGEINSKGFLLHKDAIILQENSSLVLPYASVNPYTFQEPTSPHIASINEGQPIKFSRMSEGLLHLQSKAEYVIVEGAGGWFTPLTPNQTFSDWVQQEKLPVILVVGIKLGCINHAMLTAFAITRGGLYLAGWVANNIFPPNKWKSEYLSSLKCKLHAPFLGEIPWLEEEEKEETWKYLDISVLHTRASKV